MYQVTIEWRGETKSFKSHYDWHNVTKAHMLAEDNGLSRIRSKCTTWYKALKKNNCQFCGLNYKTDICHIIPISEADDSITIATLHSPENILELCKNCHHMFDNGDINIHLLPHQLRDKIISAGHTMNYVPQHYDWSALEILHESKTS